MRDHQFGAWRTGGGALTNDRRAALRIIRANGGVAPKTARAAAAHAQVRAAAARGNLVAQRALATQPKPAGRTARPAPPRTRGSRTMNTARMLPGAYHVAFESEEAHLSTETQIAWMRDMARGPAALGRVNEEQSRAVLAAVPAEALNRHIAAVNDAADALAAAWDRLARDYARHVDEIVPELLRTHGRTILAEAAAARR